MRLTFILLIGLFSCAFLACNDAGQSAAPNPPDAPLPPISDWQLRPFEKVDSVNPILQADANPVFNCPLQKKAVKWEEKDVFNPAAIVRNDTVFLLYRAEDKIGKYAGTSRIGIAYSTDGLHFVRR